jgi:hypothetical protein
VEGAVKVFVLVKEPYCCCCGGGNTPVAVVQSEEVARMWESEDSVWRHYEEMVLNDLPAA